MNRNLAVFLGAVFFVVFIVFPTHTAEFGYLGPLWLIPLFLLAFFLVFCAINRVRRIWRVPSEEVNFSSFPQGLQKDPKVCHRCFVMVLLGIGCLLWTAISVPVLVKFSNEITRIIGVPYSSPPLWAPLIKSLIFLTTIAFNLGILFLIGAYMWANHTATRLKDATQINL